MQLQNITFPFLQKITYSQKKDQFYGFMVIELYSEEHGEIEVEIELRKTYKDERWKVGVLTCSTKRLSKEVANNLRERIEENDFRMIDLLEEEERNIKKSYEKSKQLSIENIQSLNEAADKEGRYKEEVRVKLLPHDQFFTIIIKKEKDSEKIDIELKPKMYQKEEDEKKWYPGWRNDLERLIKEYWVEKESRYLKLESKKMLV